MEGELAAYRRVEGDAAGEGFADSGHVTAERSEAIGRIDQLEGAHRQVARALKRMEDGTYGTCERCGAAIPTERLEVIPTATLCVECKQQARS